jgi:MFS transporter, YQGE family, putative transporter
MAVALSRRIRTAVGGDALGGTYYRLLTVHTGFTVFTTLPSVFINTFLMSQTSDMNVVMVYNCLSFYGTAVGMFFSAAAVHRFHSGVVSVLGILGYNLLYFELILFNAQAAQYVFLLGITNGLAGAFYWISYNQLFTEFTNLNNRDSGLAIVSIMSAIVNVIIPLIAGTVISWVGGLAGYNVIFGLAFVIALITAVGAIRLPKPKTNTFGVHHKQAFQFAFQHKAILWGLISEGCKGLREGAFCFILSILLYRLVKSEMLVGFNTFLSSAASIVSFLIISKRIQGHNRIKFMEVAVFSLLAFAVVSVFVINPVILILFTVVNAFFSGFIVNSAFSTFLDAIQAFPDSNNLRPELFAQNELYLATGRCFGIFVIMLIDHFSNSDVTMQAVSLVILTLTQIATVFACKHTMRLIKQVPDARCRQ